MASKHLLHDMWRDVVFFGGKVRRLAVFPWLTWAVDGFSTSFDEISDVLPTLQYGDVGLHRFSGYLSNVAIPGFMIHAWVHTDEGPQGGKIVEAVREGVLYRSALYPMYADYTIILRPRNVTDEERKGACLKAKAIVGTRYDVDFDFDIEKELKFFKGRDAEKAKQSLKHGRRHLRKYDPGFSCTEVAAYAWWHKSEQLGIKRTEHRGRQVIIGDTYINRGFDIHWMSKTVSPDVARTKGTTDSVALDMIADYRRAHPV